MPPEVKELLEEIQTGFEEYKKTNDALLAAKADGKATAELEAKLAKIEEEMSGHEAVKDRLDAIETAVKRGNFGGRKTEDDVKEEKSEYSDLLCKYMRGGADGGKGWTQKEAARFQELHTSLAERKFLSVQSDPDGGYWVSPDESGRMVQRIFETSPMRTVASVQVISSDSLKGQYEDDEAAVGWVGETEARPTTDTPTTGEWDIPVHEQYAKPKATQKLLDDSMVNVEQWLGNKVSRKFSREENNAFVLGDGTKKPRGFLTYDAASTIEAFERGSIGQLTTEVSLALSFDDMIELLGALKDDYAVNATWAFNRRTRTDIRKLKDDEGQYLWQPSVQVGEPATILGRPMVIFDDMPDIAANALSVAVADWAETYQIVDRSGISVLRDPYSAKPFVEFYTRKRVGGDVINFDSIKIAKIKA